jgi:heme o synthase
MRDYLKLTQPGITALIVICVAVGYWFSCRVAFQTTILTHALLGTALLASGASALKLMVRGVRCQDAPHMSPASPRRKPGNGLVFGVLLSATGFAELSYGTNLPASALGLFTLLSCFFCTPL